ETRVRVLIVGARDGPPQRRSFGLRAKDGFGVLALQRRGERWRRGEESPRIDARRQKALIVLRRQDRHRLMSCSNGRGELHGRTCKASAQKNSRAQLSPTRNHLRL